VQKLQEYFVYFKIFAQSQGENPPSRRVRRFIQRFPRSEDMAKGSQALTQARREEIIDACAKLYKTMSFKEITIKEIAAFTSFTRPAIYNYFQTKEEIFLALLQQEYEAWTSDLNALQPTSDTNSKEELAEQISHTLERRVLLLKLLSMNLNDIEQNSRMEYLVEFKTAYGNSIRALQACLQRYCPEMDIKTQQDFVFSFLPLVYGIYPYAAVTEKQRKAIEQSKIEFEFLSIYDISLIGTRKLLGGI